MTGAVDAVVIGAGVVGSAAAYLLAKERLRVCVLERDGIASGASGHGQGSLSIAGKAFRPGPHFALGLAASRMYSTFAQTVAEDGGVDPLFHELPALALALIDEEERVFREGMAWQGEHMAMRWIDGAECCRIEPRLSPEVRGAVLYRHAQVDAYRLSLGCIRAVERCGGRLLLRAATGLVRRGRRVVGVRHAGGEIACGVVVLAMGAWAGAARAWLGVPVPVRPLHGELLHLRLPGAPLPAFISTARHGSILQRRDGVVMVGSIGGASTSGADHDARHAFDPREEGTLEPDLTPTEANRDLLLERVLRIMPALEQAELLAHLAGVRPLSADRLPLIGPVPGAEGAYLAGGHGHKGIHLAPVTARIVADLIVHGRTDPALAAKAFAPARFASSA